MLLIWHVLIKKFFHFMIFELLTFIKYFYIRIRWIFRLFLNNRYFFSVRRILLVGSIIFLRFCNYFGVGGLFAIFYWILLVYGFAMCSYLTSWYIGTMFYPWCLRSSGWFGNSNWSLLFDSHQTLEISIFWNIFCLWRFGCRGGSCARLVNYCC